MRIIIIIDMLFNCNKCLTKHETIPEINMSALRAKQELFPVVQNEMNLRRTNRRPLTLFLISILAPADISKLKTFILP